MKHLKELTARARRVYDNTDATNREEQLAEILFELTRAVEITLAEWEKLKLETDSFFSNDHL